MYELKDKLFAQTMSAIYETQVTILFFMDSGNVRGQTFRGGYFVTEHTS